MLELLYDKGEIPAPNLLSVHNMGGKVSPKEQLGLISMEGLGRESGH